MDLGCGTGIVTRALSPYFDRVVGSDPSSGMIRQAREQTLTNLQFIEGNAESSTDAFGDASLDCIVASQAAHWFDFQALWPKLARVVRPGGTVAFWGYKDHVFVDFPAASAILQHYAYDLDRDKLGSYWPQPGRSYVQDKLRVIQPPRDQWEDIQRIEYEPGTSGAHSGEGTLFMERQMKIGECKEYVRTWSSYHGWTEAHPGRIARSQGGQGDVVDSIFDEIASANSWFLNDDNLIRIEWGSALIAARRRIDSD
ncbi:hypothetical protein AMS68_006467 [Peltaster fructicola]|uniref:Methyltransferase type 11 domain-containing protein n=1 Tax=Peltaster fructicola TaxID=286661 RepID=A0A6H0Y2T1_9PEZI|nr:hypothetical protein AMS68_006467 [Peltaster fructicola]